MVHSDSVALSYEFSLVMNVSAVYFMFNVAIFPQSGLYLSLLCNTDLLNYAGPLFFCVLSLKQHVHVYKLWIDVTRSL